MRVGLETNRASNVEMYSTIINTLHQFSIKEDVGLLTPALGREGEGGGEGEGQSARSFARESRQN